MQVLSSASRKTAAIAGLTVRNQRTASRSPSPADTSADLRKRTRTDQPETTAAKPDVQHTDLEPVISSSSEVEKAEAEPEVPFGFLAMTGVI